MKHYNKFLLCIFLLISLVGCGGGDSSGDEDVFEEGEEEVVFDEEVTIYDGTWLGRCNIDVFGGSSDQLRFIDGENLTTITYEYSSNDCTGDVIGLTYGEFVPTASSVCSNTQEIDFFEEAYFEDGVEQFDDFFDYYDLICISFDQSVLYFGDYDTGSGESEATRPSFIDDDTFFIRL